MYSLKSRLFLEMMISEDFAGIADTGKFAFDAVYIALRHPLVNENVKNGVYFDLKEDMVEI